MQHHKVDTGWFIDLLGVNMQCNGCHRYLMWADLNAGCWTFQTKYHGVTKDAKHRVRSNRASSTSGLYAAARDVGWRIEEDRVDRHWCPKCAGQTRLL